jgi:hypothetical protein
VYSNWKGDSERVIQNSLSTFKADNSNDGHGQQNLEVCTVGTEETLQSLLQQGVEHLVSYICRTFKASLAYGFIPMAWRQVRVTFIPKPGKCEYTKAKAYHPISLSSFLLKTTEKLVDRHIRHGVLKEHPLHKNQHAYQIGQSTELHFIMW